jgi:hypothetical protein
MSANFRSAPLRHPGVGASARISFPCYQVKNRAVSVSNRLKLLRAGINSNSRNFRNSSGKPPIPVTFTGIIFDEGQRERS